MTYFWTPSSIGLNADIERHRAKEAEILNKVFEIESKTLLSEWDKVLLHAYRNSLSQLLQSKAEVVSKIGAK